jgi:hypothetical protein
VDVVVLAVQGIGVGDGFGVGVGVGVTTSVRVVVGEDCGVGAGVETPLLIVGETLIVSANVGVVMLFGVPEVEDIVGVLRRGTVGEGVMLACFCLLLFAL